MTLHDNNKNRSAIALTPSDSESPAARIQDCWFTDATSDNRITFCLSGNGALIPLSDLLPILEKMGSVVISASSESLPDSDNDWTIQLQLENKQSLNDNPALQENFRQLFRAVIQGEQDNDRFNRLIALPDLEISDLTLLRAIARYLLQIAVPFSQSYIETTLNQHGHITRMLVQLFRYKFDPARGLTAEQRSESLLLLQQEILAELDKIRARDEDRILRSYLSVLTSMIRTNFFQQPGSGTIPKALSFKLRPALIEGMPQPVPEFETFVYSPRIEGVHLRGGKVSRGGLRWSDRREDFRTEILGLVKAQMVKNSVIVPVGAKGGFVIKQGDRDNLVVRYSEFIAALLDITDNLKAGTVIPADLVRYDDDDPYLVVAADKGTAVLSDVANTIARQYGFWLGDAFASGGANGYDHKKMGITARGAWQSTQRLFKELGSDCQQQDFSAIAIGDMSGDVFGNGMLLSEHICLVAAFNHQHIFIDPAPDARISYAERKRLFELPYSGWEDYSAELISAGGGVFSRHAKQIPLSRQIRSLCNLPATVTSLSPDELIRSLLGAPVDLLWNGGIGTYIKATQESHQEVGDRANDALRINGRDAGARIIVEGGNLGLTQAARVEFARNGGLITTDAIDNSGGVDCSDHEVNIKILLQQLQDSGTIDLQQRNRLLESMTDDVAELVLRNNYQQSKMLSQSNHTSSLFIDKHAQLIQLLEKKQLLNRELEGLPDSATMASLVKTRQGLTRPEISVLLAYSKTYLFNKLVDSDLIEDSLIRQELFNYFPALLREQYPDQIIGHPLGKEILAAQITNQVANRMGSTFCNNLLEMKKTDAGRWVKSHIAAREIFSTADLGQQIEALDFTVPNSLQMELLLKLHFPMERAAQWLLTHERDDFDTGKVVEQFRPWVNYVKQHLPELLNETESAARQQLIADLTEQGIPATLAEQISAMDYLYHALDIALIANADPCDMERVIHTYFRLNTALDLFWLRRHLNAVPIYDKWYRKAKELLSRNIDLAVRNRTQQLLNQLPLHDVAEMPLRCEQYEELISEIRVQPNPSLATVTVAIEQINPTA